MKVYVPKGPRPTEEQIEKETKDFLKSLSNSQLVATERTIRNISYNSDSSCLTSDDFDALLHAVVAEKQTRE